MYANAGSNSYNLKKKSHLNSFKWMKENCDVARLTACDWRLLRNDTDASLFTGSA